MKNIKILSGVVLFVFLFMSGCSTKDTKPRMDNKEQQDQTEQINIIETFKKKYSAVELETEGIKFSAEITDNYKYKNIYSPILYVEDVFYSDNELFMYAENFSDTKFLLKITPEQYSKINTYNNDFLFSELHIVFSLNNIEPMFPSLNARFYFDISDPDDALSDEDISLSYDTRIIRGSLIDIIEIQQ